MITSTPIGSILAVPKLAQTSRRFRYELFDMARRNGFDVDAIATVMSIESGFRPSVKNPKATASGLIQFVDATARSLGVPDGAAGVRRMSAVQQLPLVERYYQLAFGQRDRSKLRPVDYYLAGWGSGIGAPPDYVLASADEPKTFRNGTENRYTLNHGLDANQDGRITVGDLATHVARRQAQARGLVLQVFAEDAFLSEDDTAPGTETASGHYVAASSLDPFGPGPPPSTGNKPDTAGGSGGAGVVLIALGAGLAYVMWRSRIG